MTKHWTMDDELLAVTEDIFFTCPEDPRRLLGMPIGMYHCPWCGCMQIAGTEHFHEGPDVCALGLGDLAWMEA